MSTLYKDEVKAELSRQFSILLSYRVHFLENISTLLKELLRLLYFPVWWYLYGGQ